MVVRRLTISRSFHKTTSLAVALGNYDGLHLGHQAIVKHLTERATALQLQPALLTFYPHPRVFFNRDNSPRVPLCRFSQRAKFLEGLGIRMILAVRFNQSLAQLSGEEFLKWLASFGVRLIVVGEDARIGRGREMGPQQMSEFLGPLGVKVEVVSDLKAGTERISATQVRVAVQTGDMLRAYSFLGRPYQLVGRVVQGDGRGSGIGVPTINLSTPRQLMPANGVYVSRAIVAGKSYPAVTNIGVRPTFNGQTVKVESHLLNGPYPKMYREKAQIELLERLRPERRFDTVEDLIGAIRVDIAQAREKHGLKK